MRLVHRIVVAAALIALPRAACAVELGSIGLGKAFAAKACAECHDVEPGGSLSPNPEAPSFQEVADTTGMSPRALAVWLQSSHPTMPDLILSDEDTDNVIAYIMSLKTPR
jgi:mono/diheme cytochrome c family protein